MTRHTLLTAATLAVLVLGGAARTGAQAPAAPESAVAPQARPPSPPAPAPRPAQPAANQPENQPPPPVPADPDGDRDRDRDRDRDDDFEIGGRRQDVVRIGQDFSLAAGDEAREVTVIMGDARIDGHVGQLVVIMGRIQLGPTAVIDRDLTSVMGGVTVSEGARVDGEVVVVGGGLDAPASFNPGREHVVINPPFLGARMNAIVPYFTQGLMWGRVIVPGLGWVWGIVGVFFILYLLVNLLADGPVRTVATIIDERTLTAFGTGLLTLLILGPVSLLLAVSVVGLLVIPVLHCAVLAAGIVGKVATFRWLGMRVWKNDEATPMHAAGTFVIGFVLVTLIYMVPVLGLIAFALLSVLALGAATLAFLAAYRREQPPAPSAPVTPPPIPPAGPSDMTGGTDVPAIAMTSVPPPLAAPASYEVSALPRGAFRDRLAAFVLDIILVVLVVQVVWPFRGTRVFFLALLAYHIGFWAWKHTTVGGIICQLRIVRIDGVPLTAADAFIRGLSAIFSVVVLGLGFFWVLRDPERQSWHDKIAGTYVVKVPRNWRS